jgi:hypothetical protein
LTKEVAALYSSRGQLPHAVEIVLLRDTDRREAIELGLSLEDRPDTPEQQFREGGERGAHRRGRWRWHAGVRGALQRAVHF